MLHRRTPPRGAAGDRGQGEVVKARARGLPRLLDELSQQHRLLAALHCHARGLNYAIASRFYPASRQAYIGTALFYAENADMKAFHEAYHPRLVEFLGEAMFVYAHREL